MDWTNWIGLTPTAFERKLRRRLTKPCRYNDLVHLYNELIVCAHQEPTRISAIATAVSTLFMKRGLKREAVLFIELAARCHFINRDTDLGFASLRSLIDLDPVGARQVALDLAREVKDHLDRYGTSLDQRPRIFAAVGSILHRYGRFEELGDIHLEAAMLYSRHNARQAAYRSVNDAESIAREIRSLPLYARTYKTAAAVAAEEGDFEWSIGAAKKALKAFRLARIAPPIDLFSNLAVAQMNVDQYQPAVVNFQAALNQVPAAGTVRSAIKVNLAACLRRMGDLDAAAVELASAESESMGKTWPDSALELAFGKAKLAEARHDAGGVAEYLKEITRCTDAVLTEVLRLHHRRGIRERFIPRIEALLHALPDQGNVDDVILPLAASRGSAFGDWLAILGWAEEVAAANRVSPAIARQLKATLDLLKNFGVPHLYGFREKYDDPWEPGNYGAAWDMLSEISAKLGELGLTHPVRAASCSGQAALCRTRLAEDHCLMMMTYAGDNALLWCLIGDRYVRKSVSYDLLDKWNNAQLRYAAGEASRAEFISAIDQLIGALGPLVEPIFGDVATAGCLSVRFIQDFGSGLPLTMFALRNDELLKRMALGQFEFRLVPAMHEANKSEALQYASVAAIVDPHEDLLLAPHEGKALTSAAQLLGPLVITNDDERDLREMLAERDILLVSTHGHSLQFFTDAYFARLGTDERPHPISVASLQVSAPDLALKLVILNTCYSGSISARNYQHKFRTSDAVSMPNLFLLNRTAVAVAGSWKISDTASFVFASLIGEGIKRRLTPSAAISSAIARLCDLPKAQVLAILDANLDTDALETAKGRLNNAPDTGMFSHPYIAAGFTIHGLL